LLARHVAAVADRLVETLAAEPGEVDLLEHMHYLAIEVAGRAMFSLEMDTFGPPMREMLRDYTERLAQAGALDVLLPPFLPAPQDFARWRFRRRWLRLIDEIVAARQKKVVTGAPRDLLDLMAVDPETGMPVPRRRLADQVATMIAAGHATTAVALFWAFYLVASTPAVQQRIAAEAAPLDLGPESAAEALGQLPYTRATVQEALRLYPPAFGVFRLARHADQAGGVAVPKGAIVMIAPWLLHRHRRLWAAPDVFDPARFLPGAPTPDRFAYLPFGAGPRVCIGAQFALTEATLVLARLVREFTISRADNEPVIPVAAITVRPDRPPPFRLRPR
jgi:cytochrome P450